MVTVNEEDVLIHAVIVQFIHMVTEKVFCTSTPLAPLIVEMIR